MQCAQIISGYFKFAIGLLVGIHSMDGPPLSHSPFTPAQCQVDQGQGTEAGTSFG